MKNKVGGVIGLILTALLLVLYLPPLVMYGILDIGGIIGFVLAALALIFAIQQFRKAADDAPKREYDKSVSGGTRGRLHRMYNHDMGRSTVLIERGGLGRFTADTSIGYDGDKTSHAGLIAWIVILLIIVAFFAQGLVRMFSVNEAGSGSSSNVIVLGCGVRGTNPTIMLRQRIEAARLYLAENPKAVAVVSGGKGPGEDISEAECMKQYLTDATKASSDKDYFYQACDMHGVPEKNYSEVPVIDKKRILTETKSVNTRQNISNSINTLVMSKKDVSNVVIVTQWYHEYRAANEALVHGSNALAYSAAIDWWGVATYTTRECLSILYYSFL
ncbi:MAG: YdcF family protein [Lachnospiraceae bacterium]|uniref:YdcF family protein n=1 Tax=Candidatus Weimeria bifida TaxID=2599074 RepID=A0A6N7J0H7_9FIRM|nr:YdcF family protein [Candidatus Weimeria bifida]RRF97076.1 MAG: YdcF family protein [Lachnospiraceae bacterium]